MSDFFIFVSRLFGIVSRKLAAYSNSKDVNSFQHNEIIKSTNYNMVTAADEPYYAEQYWEVIEPYLKNISSNPRVVDLGCSQGRFSIKLAKYFPKGYIVGCDISESAINYAKSYALEENIKNVDFRNTSISDTIGEEASNSIDLIFMTEVTFFYPNWINDMPIIINRLKAGGLLVISFRPQYFYLLHLIRNKMFHNINLLFEGNSGSILDNSINYTWLTSKGIIEFFETKYKLQVKEMFGIGTCSGISGDPHDSIISPSKLLLNDRKKLFDAEMILGKQLPDAGRYILSIIEK